MAGHLPRYRAPDSVTLREMWRVRVGPQDQERLRQLLTVLDAERPAGDPPWTSAEAIRCSVTWLLDHLAENGRDTIVTRLSQKRHNR